jgi:two-component system, cell cycle sensor histidine kinase and response regulator CckA
MATSLDEAARLSSLFLTDAARANGENPQIGELLAAAHAAVRDLLDGCPPGDPLQERLRNVEQAVERLATLTGQLDATVRRRTPRATPLDLNNVLRQMASSLQRLLGPFINLETALHASSLWASGDRSQIEQVALGLVINAREALPLGGTVRLATRRWVSDKPVQYRIGTLPAGSWAVVEVHDNGASVDDRSVRHLLEPATRGRSPDSGLSLATVTSVVTQAGGQVVLDVPASGGTTLSACFPAVQSPRARQPATGIANAVLIVDSDEWSRMSAARTLRQAGFGVLEAGHSDDAMELLDDVAGSCIRLIMVEVGLLSSGDHPLANRLARERPEIDVVVMANHRSSTGGPGQPPLLTKPFSAEELLRTVRERLLDLG